MKVREQRKDSRETGVQLVQRRGRVPVPPQGMYLTIWHTRISELFYRDWGPTRWRMVTSGWVQAQGPQTGWNHKADDGDSWSPTRLSPHQTIRGGSHTQQPSPQILPIETLPPKTSEIFEHKPHILLAWPCTETFSAQTPIFRFVWFVWHMDLSPTTIRWQETLHLCSLHIPAPNTLELLVTGAQAHPSAGN